MLLLVALPADSRFEDANAGQGGFTKCVVGVWAAICGDRGWCRASLVTRRLTTEKRKGPSHFIVSCGRRGTKHSLLMGTAGINPAARFGDDALICEPESSGGARGPPLLVRITVTIGVRGMVERGANVAKNPVS